MPTLADTPKEVVVICVFCSTIDTLFLPFYSSYYLTIQLYVFFVSTSK